MKGKDFHHTFNTKCDYSFMPSYFNFFCSEIFYFSFECQLSHERSFNQPLLTRPDFHEAHHMSHRQHIYHVTSANTSQPVTKLKYTLFFVCNSIFYMGRWQILAYKSLYNFHTTYQITYLWQVQSKPSIITPRTKKQH